MYFVDRDQIEQTLIFLENQIALFEEKGEWTSAIEKAALERLTHTMIEAILDVGNSMIDGFIMRDPGSYDDIVDILTDESVITEDMSNNLKKIISYRKVLVQTYIHIDHDDLKGAFTAHLPTLRAFAPSVREYLRNELGPVSAFKN